MAGDVISKSLEWQRLSSDRRTTYSKGGYAHNRGMDAGPDPMMRASAKRDEQHLLRGYDNKHCARDLHTRDLQLT